MSRVLAQLYIKCIRDDRALPTTNRVREMYKCVGEVNWSE